MQVQVEYCGEVAVVAWPQTRLDATNANQIKGIFAPRLASCSRVVLDLTALRFIDASGLGALIDYLERLLNRGCILKLGGVCKSVQTSFELLRLHRLVEMFSTREEAILEMSRSS